MIIRTANASAEAKAKVVATLRLEDQKRKVQANCKRFRKALHEMEAYIIELVVKHDETRKAL